MKIICTLIFTIVFVSGIAAQDCQKRVSGKEFPVQNIEPIDLKNYEKWKKIDLPQFSFYIPQGLVQKKIKGIDSIVYEFGDDNFVLGIDVDIAAYRPSYEFNEPSFCESFAWIDDAFAWIWHYEGKEKQETNKFKSGVYFQFREDKNYAIGATISSKNNDKETPEKIFQSFQFKYKPKEKQKTPETKKN